MKTILLFVCLIFCCGILSCGSEEEVTAQRSLNRATDRILGGWDSDYGSCYDVDKAQVHGSSQMENPNVAPMIDLFFDKAQLWNIDGAGLNRLPDTGIRFAKTDITSAQFDSMTDDKLFASIEPKLEVIPIQVGDVVFFKSKNGKKGLLRIKAMTAPTGDLTIDELIQNR